VETVRHVAKSLKVFYADCSIVRTDEQVRAGQSTVGMDNRGSLVL
jgi:hypothetical protein